MANNKAYLLLNGSYFQSDELFTHPEKTDTSNDNIWNLTAGHGVIRAKLKVGDKYYDTQTNAWVENECSCLFPVGGYGKSRPWYEWNEISNNVNYTMHIDKIGFAIPMSSIDNLAVKIDLTLYRPQP